MANEFRFPDLGEGIHEGSVVKWHVREGDAVAIDQVLAEVETDKAVVEIPSPYGGYVLRLNFKEGEVVKVGEVLLVIGQANEAVAQTQVHGFEAHANAPLSGAATLPPAAPTASSPQPVPGHHLATPATRRLARELGVDITKVIGTGPAGRVTDFDVNRVAQGGGPAQTILPQQPHAAPAQQPQQMQAAFAQQMQAEQPQHAAAAFQNPQATYGPSVSAGIRIAVPTEEGDQRVPLTHMRKVIAERMVYSKTHIPHACGMDYVDVTRLSEVREKEKKNFEPQHVKLTFLPFIIKAVAIALKEYPKFNAHFDEEKSELVIRKQHNVGIAVDTPEGLMVPVVKDVDRKSIVEIAQDIEHLAIAAKERKLKLDEMRGGTFTITNVGSVGGMYSTPIINPPEVAIMGVHRIKELPMMMEDKMKPRRIMGISMCFDHRVADGAEATLFMNAVMKHLEDPDLMLVDMI